MVWKGAGLEPKEEMSHSPGRGEGEMGRAAQGSAVGVERTHLVHPRSELCLLSPFPHPLSPFPSFPPASYLSLSLSLSQSLSLSSAWSRELGTPALV